MKLRKLSRKLKIIKGLMKELFFNLKTKEGYFKDQKMKADKDLNFKKDNGLNDSRVLKE